MKKCYTLLCKIDYEPIRIELILEKEETALCIEYWLNTYETTIDRITGRYYKTVEDYIF